MHLIPDFAGCEVDEVCLSVFGGFLLYMYLRNRASEYRQCFPAIGTIAKDLSYSKRTVYRALDDLEAKGFVKREERWGTKGGRSSSFYVLTEP